MEILNGITLSLLCCGVSVHHTDQFAPQEGYRSYHETLGAQVEYNFQSQWHGGLLYLNGLDSYGESMNLAVTTLKYRFDLGSEFAVSPGLGAGYADTSYYSGPYAAPMFELEWEDIALQAAHQFKTGTADSVTAVQLKVMWEF